MKKLLSLVLTCVLALTLAAPALAENFYLEDMGITVVVPEGMTVEDISPEESYLLSITVDGDESLKYAFALSFIEEFDGKNIEDLEEEEGNMLIQGFEIAIPDLQYEAVETEMFNMIVLTNGDNTQLHYVTLMGGWLFDVAVGRADGPLTDEDIQAAADMLFNLEFDEEE